MSDFMSKLNSIVRAGMVLPSLDLSTIPVQATTDCAERAIALMITIKRLNAEAAMVVKLESKFI
jgi:hypothetical protein